MGVAEYIAVAFGIGAAAGMVLAGLLYFAKDICQSIDEKIKRDFQDHPPFSEPDNYEKHFEEL